MKSFIVLAVVLAVAAAQFPGFPGPPRVQPFVRPTIPPPFIPSPSPTPAINVNRIVGNEQNARILRYDNEVYPDGSFNYAYDTENGISAQAQGTPREFPGTPQTGPVRPVVIQGSFSWTSPEGEPIVITYIADENGYQPSGNAIPTPPPIPEPILRSLEFNARNAPPQKK